MYASLGFIVLIGESLGSHGPWIDYQGDVPY